MMANKNECLNLAAPDLLEACKVMAAELQTMKETFGSYLTNSGHGELCSAINVGQAAIAKAAGKES